MQVHEKEKENQEILAQIARLLRMIEKENKKKGAT